eukprot:CAMPEP_0116894746 /NCGR_PEP_ID=MMETSP0467-20121206/4444_1 /TAXON_ID=283647 /ORGANISM="Mesodinium pulex, Strain SPMC105" /LENGTH=112 /DNA_ID=CAMNT_0004565133 /DNA_START=713 /DNA_END=1051 /DNA_ORIENTATION=-
MSNGVGFRAKISALKLTEKKPVDKPRDFNLRFTNNEKKFNKNPDDTSIYLIKKKDINKFDNMLRSDEKKKPKRNNWVNITSKDFVEENRIALKQKQDLMHERKLHQNKVEPT